MDAASKPVISGIHRRGPPQATKKVREGVYAIQVALSEAPSADWKRFFYDLNREHPPEFPPRSVDVSGATLRFRCEAQQMEERVALIDRWIERANRKESSLGPRSEEERRRREEVTREHVEMAEWNARWAKL